LLLLHLIKYAEIIVGNSLVRRIAEGGLRGLIVNFSFKIYYSAKAA